ncbi:MAG: aromatic ring-hydroxylating oxygenase subunit alpha [Anaerolineales bacterium]
MRTLPRRYYTSEEILIEETERIFYKQWLCIGRADQIPMPGDYFVQAVGTESLIITRDRDGQPRAFYNVCRHRGTQICEASQGKFHNSIQCPYHAWTYGLDGRLLGAPNMQAVNGFAREQYPLYAVRIETWQGFLFINLDPNAEPLTQTYAALAGKFERWDVARLNSAHRITYDVQANWKLLIENYDECYHCPLVHPALAELSPYDSGDNDLTEGPYLGGFMLIKHESMTLTGRSQRPALGTVADQYLQRVYYYSLSPNLLLSLHPDYVMYHTLWPQSPSRTLIHCEWLFDPQTMAQPDFDPADAVEFWDMTNKQDWHICEQSQIGLRSRVYQPGPLQTEQEMLPAAFDREVLKALGHI